MRMLTRGPLLGDSAKKFALAERSSTQLPVCADRFHSYKCTILRRSGMRSVPVLRIGPQSLSVKSSARLEVSVCATAVTRKLASGPVRTTQAQAFAQRRSALHEVAPQPLLHAIYLRAVADAADGVIGTQFMRDIQQR